MDPYTQTITSAAQNVSADSPDSASASIDPYTKTVMPSDIANAKQNIGSHSDDGLCQAFVEKMVYGKTGIFPSAANAWNYYAQKGLGKTDVQNMQPGDIIYFQGDQSNGNDGHVGIYAGNGTMVDATYNGVEQNNISQWQKQTGQQIAGYVPTRGAMQ